MILAKNPLHFETQIQRFFDCRIWGEKGLRPEKWNGLPCVMAVLILIGHSRTIGYRLWVELWISFAEFFLWM